MYNMPNASLTLRELQIVAQEAGDGVGEGDNPPTGHDDKLSIFMGPDKNGVGFRLGGSGRYGKLRHDLLNKGASTHVESGGEPTSAANTTLATHAWASEHHLNKTSAQTFGGHKTFSDDITVTGNLTVNGNTTTISTTNLTVKDNLIELNRELTDGAAVRNDAGLLVQRGNADENGNAFMGWDESAQKFTMGYTEADAESVGNLTVATGTLVANLEGNVNGATVTTSGNVSVGGDLAVTAATTLTGQLNLPAAIANAAASTLTVVDNEASAFTIGSTGKADILKIVSSNGAEGVSMSGTLDVTGAVTTPTLLATSDRRAKKDIVPVENSKAIINELQPVYWNWKANNKASCGLVAQDVQEVAADAVHSSGDKLSLNYNYFIGVLVARIKEMGAEIDALKAQH